MSTESAVIPCGTRDISAPGLGLGPSAPNTRQGRSPTTQHEPKPPGRQRRERSDPYEFDKRTTSPFRRDALTGRYAQQRIHTMGSECSPVCSTFHQFSMKRVLSASYREALSVDSPRAVGKGLEPKAETLTNMPGTETGGRPSTSILCRPRKEEKDGRHRNLDRQCWEDRRIRIVAKKQEAPLQTIRNPSPIVENHRS